jgi:hypothetical protein
MRHVLLPDAPTTGPYRMGQPPTAARLVAPTGVALGVISGLLRTAAGTIDLTAVAAAANKHLSPTTDTHEQPGRRRHRRGLAHAWTTIVMLGIMPRHACSARRGARRRFRTWRFRSAPCLPIWQVVNAQLCARSIASHLRRTPTCGYVDNASALPTDPQDQKNKSKRQFDCFESAAVKPGPSQPRPSGRAAATPVAAFGIYPGRHSHGASVRSQARLQP